MKAYVKRDEKQYGPYPIEDIRGYVESGQVVGSDLCRADDSSDWCTVSNFLASCPAELPPIPPASVEESPLPSSAAASPNSNFNVPANPEYNGAAAEAIYVSRQGQQYGPWMQEEVRSYVAQGNLLMSDMARTGTTQSWAPLSTILAAPRPPLSDPQGSKFPSPPNLHWVLLALIMFFTTGLFGGVWLFVQSVWIKKINSRSMSTTCLALGVLAACIAAPLELGGLISGAFGFGARDGISYPIVAVIVGGLVGLAAPVFFLSGLFSMKRSLEAYYNHVEPIGLELNSALVIFFNVFYFQYHMTRIADWKRTGILA